MRLLFTTPPGTGHLLPVLPLAWAALAAGHAVLVATSGPNVGIAARSGLLAVEIAPGADVTGEFDRLNQDTHLAGADLEVVRRHGALRFAAIGDLTLDGLVRLTDRWRPDVIVHDPYQVSGLVAAHIAGIPSVVQANGLPMRPFLPALQAMTRQRHHGVTSCPSDATAMLNTCPASVDPPRSHRGWPMRYVLSDLAGPLPRWAAAPPSAPRICVTFGSALSGRTTDPLRSTVDALRGMPVEVVLCVGGADRSELGTLPPNMRAVDWLPLSVVLPGCSLVVHHGGAGTTFGALAAGVPQVMLPYGADWPVIADTAARRGAGISVATELATPATIGDAVRRVLDDPAYRSAAREVALENAARPSPDAVLIRMAELIS